MAMLGEEIMDLECKVRDLVVKLHEHEVFTLGGIKVGSSIRKVVVLREKD
jgi:proteasome assembly chaperone (PAC2) family protein